MVRVRDQPGAQPHGSAAGESHQAQTPCARAMPVRVKLKLRLHGLQPHTHTDIKGGCEQTEAVAVVPKTEAAVVVPKVGAVLVPPKAGVGPCVGAE